MLGLDKWLVELTDNPIIFVLAISTLLGFRHATDPDHLAAVLTMRFARPTSALRIGLAWGIGHGVTMFVIGVPLILLVAEMPTELQRGLEFAVGAMIVGLALRVIVRATSTHLHAHSHHDGSHHTHHHTHRGGEHVHRTPRQAVLMGLIHGAGGSAGIVALILGRLSDPRLAIAALAVIAVCTAVSMMMCSWLMSYGLDQATARIDPTHVILVGGALTLLFGLWYCVAALDYAPYPL